jgi:hypothetical protein
MSIRINQTARRGEANAIVRWHAHATDPARPLRRRHGGAPERLPKDECDRAMPQADALVDEVTSAFWSTLPLCSVEL